MVWLHRRQCSEENVHLKHLLINLGFSLDIYYGIPVDIIQSDENLIHMLLALDRKSVV